MTISSHAICLLPVIAAALLFSCGCGSSTAPIVTSSQDEMSAYLEAHPELKDAKPDEIITTGT